MASKFVDMFGETVLNGKGEATKVSSLVGEGKVVGIYFSAHWCGPCRAFTPKLKEFYNKMKATDKGSQLEIVFVSSDKDEEAFKEYFKEMPWHAVAYSDRDRKTKLSSKFKVRGIPTLVFLDGQTGNIVSSDVRSALREDPEGKNFPWRDKTFLEIMPGKLLAQDGKEVDFDADLKGKVLGVYFSAHWCPPCKGFTPDLVKFYKKMQEAKEFDIIFASSDRDAAAFKEYFGEMPWKAIPFGDDRKTQLSKLYGVSGIPTLVWIDKDGKTITTGGRACVGQDPDGKEFPWYPKPINELTGSHASKINDEACLIYFCKEGEDSVTVAKDAMKDTAEKVLSQAKAEDKDQELLFFFAKSDEEMIDSLTEFAGLSHEPPQLVILDVPQGAKYVCDKKEFDATVVSQFVDDFLAGKLEKQTLQ